jgi:hypothetical protein
LLPRCLKCIFFFTAVYGDNRWSPIPIGEVGGGADTLDLTHAEPHSASSRSVVSEAGLSDAESEWWVRQDRSMAQSNSGDQYTLAHDADGDGNVDLYDMSRISHDEMIEMAPLEGARRLDTYGDDVLVYEVRTHSQKTFADI